MNSGVATNSSDTCFVIVKVEYFEYSSIFNISFTHFDLLIEKNSQTIKVVFSFGFRLFEDLFSG